MIEHDRQLLHVNGHERVGLKQGRTLIGVAVAWCLKREEKVDLAQQAHTYLLMESDNMEVIGVNQLIASMNEGNTVVKRGNMNELLGFTRLEEDKHDPRRIVVGSWLGIRHPDYQNGSGAEVMRHAAELAFINPAFSNTREVIARVRADNEGPQRVLRRLGAELENNVPILSPKTKNFVNVYNLTMVGLGRI